jgi:mono/diheme cytochrome c family protein
MKILLLTIAVAACLQAKVKFERDVKPILEQHCVRCHGADGAMKGLRLDKKERALMGVVKKKPDESRIYAASKTGFMPPGEKKLTPAELDALRRWILEGAKWPNGMELVGRNPFLEEKK